MIYRRGINIVLLILSFLAVHLYGAASSKDNFHAAYPQQQTTQKATRFSVTRDIAKVLASGEGNSSEFLFQRIQHQQTQQAQNKVQAPSLLLCLFVSAFGFSAKHTHSPGLVAPITGFLPVVYKLLYPKHWFW